MNSVRHSDVELASPTVCVLGKSALWDNLVARLFWVDTVGGTIYARYWSDDETAQFVVQDLIGSIALRAEGGLVAALRHRIAFCDIDARIVEPVRDVESGRQETRLDDGAVDPHGRFWVASMDVAQTSPTGALYCLYPDTSMSCAFSGIISSSAPAWSPDGKTLYYADSAHRIIYAFDFDLSAGAIGQRRVFVDDRDRDWHPDGVTVDSDGFVWNCQRGSGRIVRYAPDGSVDRILNLPVPQVTRCAFAGPDLDVLAVTTARVGLDSAMLAEAPLSGHVLLADPGPRIRGLPTSMFQG